MTKQELDAGLKAVGERLSIDINIVVTGSAALVLTQDISREADDCDLGDIAPKGAEDSLLKVGNQVAEILGYTQNWLNASNIAWQSDFPECWRARLIAYEQIGTMMVYLMSRADCVSMLLLRMMNDKNPNRDVAEIQLSVDEKSLVYQYTRQMESEYDMSRAQIALGLT